MLRKNKTHKVLKILNERNLTGSEIDSICNNSYTNLQTLMEKKLIWYAIDTEDQGFQEPFTLTNKGREYLSQKEDERIVFWKNFFSNFISGFVLGVLSTLIGAYLLNILGLK